MEPREAERVLRVTPMLGTIKLLPSFLEPGNMKRRRRFVSGWVVLNVTEAMFHDFLHEKSGEENGVDWWIPETTRKAFKKVEATLLQLGE